MHRGVLRLAHRLGHIPTQDEIGELVAREEGKASPYAGSVVARWLKGQAGPKTRDGWRALARVFDVSAGWLAFGDGPEPTGPALPPVTPSLPSPSELKRLEEATKAKKKHGRKGA